MTRKKIQPHHHAEWACGGNYERWAGRVVAGRIVELVRQAPPNRLRQRKVLQKIRATVVRAVEKQGKTAAGHLRVDEQV